MGPLSLLRSNIRDLANDPKGYLQMVADRMHNSVLGQQAVANQEGMGMMKLSPSERTRQIQQAILDNSGGGSLGGALGVIKPRGGNWLTGSVEKALSGLRKYAEPSDIAMLERNIANPETAGIAVAPETLTRWQNELKQLKRQQVLNKWIEGPLTKYVKRDMASPEDPIRKLAEQGILHYVPERASEEFIHPTQRFMGKSRLARDWEEVADLSLDQHLAREVPRWELGPGDDWVKKLDPTTPVYQAGSTYGYDSGFRHLVDELQNSLNPNSDLPRHLRLTPEQMQQMGIEKAVRHVADVNAWRAAQKAEANAELAQSPAVHLVKEYPENNPKGLRWVELKQPETTHEVLAQWEREYPERVQESGHDAVARNKLQEQLKYEGDMMGHCVGGYCEDVANGNSRIFSLRDAKGEPHVTIEASPIMSKLSGDTLNEIYPGIWDKVVDEGGHRDLHKWVRENKPEVVDMMSIMQIKGKANKAPIDEYVPFVQDFIKSQPWGSIRDLQNAQMWKHPKTGQYFTKAETEADEALQSIYDSRNLDDDGNYVGGYAEGGKVPTREEYLQQLGVTFQD